jgi:hypothetical protein
VNLSKFKVSAAASLLALTNAGCASGPAASARTAPATDQKQTTSLSDHVTRSIVKCTATNALVVVLQHRGEIITIEIGRCAYGKPIMLVEGSPI